jgi:stearoyl-CoA desaturase (Delta-9 desaturase)
MVILVFFILHWYLSLFTQSFLDHRYAAHGAFIMSRRWERFFFILAYVFQGSSYLSPRAYAIMHRMHHAYTDTPKDPHSPKYFPNIFSMFWTTKNVYNSIYYKKTDIEERFTKNVPDWPALDRLGDSAYSRIGWSVGYIVFYYFFATYWWMYLLIPVHIMMGPVHGAIINWFAHKYGYINFKLNNTSKNLLPVDILMLGESYHNNHHKYASSINFGVRWFEIDPVYYIIRLFDFAGIVKIKDRSVKRIVTEF